MPEPTRRSFIVEFAGLPGAGKSTLSHAAATAVRESGEIVTEPSREIMHDRRRLLRKCVRKCVLAAGTLVRGTPCRAGLPLSRFSRVDRTR